MADDRKDRVAAVIDRALLPYTMATAVKPVLKRTPAYEDARRDRESRAWLEEHSIALGREIAEVVQRYIAGLG